MRRRTSVLFNTDACLSLITSCHFPCVNYYLNRREQQLGNPKSPLSFRDEADAQPDKRGPLNSEYQLHDAPLTIVP
jgi:hypothetical protein